jgi:hypothetical protein
VSWLSDETPPRPCVGCGRATSDRCDHCAAALCLEDIRCEVAHLDRYHPTAPAELADAPPPEPEVDDDLGLARTTDDDEAAGPWGGLL